MDSISFSPELYIYIHRHCHRTRTGYNNIYIYIYIPNESTLFIWPSAIYVPWRKQQGGNTHLFKNEINISFKKYKFLSESIPFEIFTFFSIWTNNKQKRKEKFYMYIYIYIYIYIQSQWYLIPSCLRLSVIKYVSRVKCCNSGKRLHLSVVAIEKGPSRTVTKFTYIYIYIYVCINMWMYKKEKTMYLEYDFI